MSVPRVALSRIALFFLCWVLVIPQPESGAESQLPSFQQRPAIQQVDYRSILVSLTDPAKLATLGDRGANPRLKKIVYWLEQAREAGHDPAQVIDQVLQQNGYGAAHAALVKTNLLRNIKICDELGFFASNNILLLRSGFAPTVMRGPYAGDQGQVDHIIPFSVAPEIGNDLSNLELMPGKLNNKKRAKVGQRQKDLADKLHDAGVINEVVLNRILSVKTANGASLDGELAYSATATSTPAFSSRVAAQNPKPPAVVYAPKTVPSSTSGMVWLNTASSVYHMPGTRWYGKTKQGRFMSESEAIKAGDREAGNGQ